MIRLYRNHLSGALGAVRAGKRAKAADFRRVMVVRREIRWRGSYVGILDLLTRRKSKKTEGIRVTVRR